MNKQEIYYKFIFPDYENLTIYNDSDLNYVPESDNVGQKGEVRALCNACPERVITYDQLTASNPEPMYINGTNGWTSVKKSAIKSYIDAWLNVPKYFNLRNYEDSIPTQRLGMSLMVSHTPEVGGDYSDWTKLRVGGKTVYFSLMVSSGDFFYGFTLPDKVINKSGLRDKIVNERFHSNWFFTKEEQSEWSNKGLPNVDVGQEKRVFAQHYFNENYPYGYQAAPKFFVYYYNGNSKYLRERVSCEDKDGNVYKGTNKDFPPHAEVSRYYLTDNSSVDLTRSQRYTSGDVRLQFIQDSPHYFLKDSNIEVSPIRTVELYVDFNEDLKRDFIDLEATRRILYYDDTNNNDTQLKYTDNGITRYSSIVLTRDIPTIKSGKYYNTVLSYEPPQVYTDAPPLQIPYNLLRYTLNDRPPFTDCETVLVMWVADSGKDPDDTADNNVKALHELEWQQYAIPISCRCCYKQPVNGEKFSNERFLVSYPNQWVINSQVPESTYRYHIRCSEAYSKDVFKEVLYLRDLVAYSNDYIIAYQNTGVKYHRKGFDIQGYLFKNYEDHFAKLYVPKTFNQPSSNDGHTDTSATGLSMNTQGQFYYIRVNQKDSTGNDIFYINIDDYPNTQTSQHTTRKICIRKPSTTETFKPSEHIYRLTYNNEKWDPNATTFVAPSTKVSILGEVKDFGFDDLTYHDKYGYNDWQINDSYLIALFNKPTDLQEKSNVLLTLDSSNGKGKSLYDLLHDVNENWGDDLYISSLGVTQYNPVLVNSVFYGSGQSTICSLGILDNYIKLSGTVYGSSTSTKQVIVGFKNMLDFHQEDLYHFRYDTATETYNPVTVQYDYNTRQFIETKQSGFNCTAYVMNYS